LIQVAAILAAGASRRLGLPKQLLRLPNGLSLLQHSVQQALDAHVTACAVVTGRNAVVVADHLSGLPVSCIPSENAEEGVAASVRAAAAWAQRQRADALLLCVCDQPRLTSQHLAALLAASQRHRQPAASFYADKPAVPAVFTRPYFAQLRQLHGDQGAGALLAQAQHVELVVWPEGELDIDTVADWTKASALLQPR
jgi:CTP:molybdopterin cytidylyltransferase MocA